MAEEIDGIEYVEKLTASLKKLNMTVTTKMVVNEDKIAQKVADKMQRGLQRRSSESIGGF